MTFQETYRKYQADMQHYLLMFLHYSRDTSGYFSRFLFSPMEENLLIRENTFQARW